MQEDQKPHESSLKLLPLLPLKSLAILLSLLLGLLFFHILQPDFTLNHEPPAELTVEEGQQPTPTEAEPQPPANTRVEFEVKNGDTLSSLFKGAGFGPQLVDEILASNKEAKVLKSLFPGNRLNFEIDAEHALVSLEVSKSQLENYRFARKPSGGFEYQHTVREPDIKLAVHEAVINDTLFTAAQNGGIPNSTTMELISIFGGVIDYIMDIRKGDTFRILVEEQYLDGERIGFGNIRAAEFINQGKSFTAVRYKDAAGNVGFFSPDGESMRKAFLLNPVDIVRVSSGFSLSRKHPILNTIRAHKGTDYAAPIGTKVYATSDGRITFAGINGSFGKLIVIQHSGRFATKYAHLSNFAKIAKQGARVRQGEVIGFVGATGAATGPHLHYEFLVDGAHRDSRKYHDKLPQAESLGPKEMAGFKQLASQYLAQLRDWRNAGTLTSTASTSQPGKSRSLQ